MKRYFKISSWLLAAFILIASVFVHPFGNVKATASRKPLFREAQIDLGTFNLMQRSCQSCHSERTVWPWYSYVAPVSWMIEKDVRDGRDRFNMSHWDEYGQEERERILSEISTLVRNKKMPLPQYTWLHPGAKLSDGDVGLIYQWGHRERKRLKTEIQ